MVFQRIAPIFPVRDVAASFVHYERLGFVTRRYRDGDEYGFANREGIEIHLGVAPGAFQAASAYLFVDDAERLAEEWRSAGVEVHGPEDTPWGRHEGAVADPDGNVIRFGSPVRAPGNSRC